MKNKQKLKEKQESASLGAENLDLKSIIHDQSLFIDKLVELIPARFYLSSNGTDKPWFQGLSKAEKASMKQKSRENIKKARRDRLDPEKSSSTTLDLLKESLENEKSDAQLDGDSDVEAIVMPVPPITDVDDGEQAVTYEQLRQRLHKRIEELRGGRGSSNNLKRNHKNEKRERDKRQKKRKRDAECEETKGKEKGNTLPKKDACEAVKDLEFGKVKLDIEEERGKKRKISKEKELDRARRLEEAKKDPERGEVVAKKHSWKAATNRAAGIKVHDDPKLIKQSMQKEKKRHKKNVGKWKERIEAREKVKEEKQQARSEHIAERINQKKMRKIAKREKKRMRPGFEGRKEGYINDVKAQGD